ncbi:hypothetical protein acdb102_27530 [Acidothermaceae bacterium B102]|nr:hypothetical protein acdb102_27530 [Acidothermaceae bacterium B102]
MDTPDEVSAGLVERALEALRAALGSTYVVEPYHTQHGDSADSDNSLITLKDSRSGTYVTVLLEAKQSLTPAFVRTNLAPRFKLMRQLPNSVSPLVVAPWLSAATRVAIAEAGANYLDLTGNTELDIAYPRILIRTSGQRRSPAPASPGQRSLNGPRAGRLVRLLADTRPPYGASALAAHTQLSPPYVSRLLDVLIDQGLIERVRRQVTEVDWAAMLTARAQETKLLVAHPATGFLAPQGIPHLMATLAGRSGLPQLAVTGSYAAAAVAPVAMEGQLLVFTAGDADVPATARALGLIATDRGGDVLLLRANDVGVFSRSRLIHGVPHVALSQLVVDCLSGPGRLPTEGAAILEYMRTTEDEWRLPNLAAAAAA